MGFVMPHMLILVAMAVAALALLLQIIGLATTGWVVIGNISNSGLWEGCSTLGCFTISYVPDWMEACRAFGILGILALAASLLCGVLIGLMSEQKIFTLLAPLTSAVAAFCILIEFAVYAGELDSGTGGSGADYLGYSFALTVTAFVLAIVAAVLFFVGRTRSAA